VKTMTERISGRENTGMTRENVSLGRLELGRHDDTMTAQLTDARQLCGRKGDFEAGAGDFKAGAQGLGKHQDEDHIKREEEVDEDALDEAAV